MGPERAHGLHPTSESEAVELDSTKDLHSYVPEAHLVS